MRKALLFALLVVFFAFPAVPGRAAQPTRAQKARAALALAAAARQRAKPRAIGPCGIPGCACGCSSGGSCTCVPYYPQAAKRVCACTSPADCICTKGTCDCPQCAARAYSTYGEGYKAAVARGVPLVVWVGFPAAPAGRLPGARCVQCVDDSGACGHMPYPGGSFVVIARPDGRGQLDFVTRLGGNASDDDIKTWMMARPQPVPLPVQTFAPQFFAPPPMLFRGGFGGGCGAGG